MPLIYGEGEVNAFKRLREEIDKLPNGKFVTPVDNTVVKASANR